MKFYLLLPVFLLSYSLQAQYMETVVSVTGVVKNVENAPVSGNVIVTNDKGETINKTRCNGKYFITGLKPGETYNITIDSKGYFENTFEINVPNTDKYNELSKDVEMKVMEAGAKLAFKVIPFDTRSSKIRPGSDLFLEDYVKILRSNPRAKFTIEVFPEKEGNNAVTLQRAEELKKYFQENRVRAELNIDSKNVYDPQNLPPQGKQAKGKRYKGSIYLVVNNL